MYKAGRAVPSGTLPDEENITSPYIVPDKADLFLAYPTVPGYRKHTVAKPLMPSWLLLHYQSKAGKAEKSDPFLANDIC